MASPSHDVLVIGAGALGLATAFELARRGRSIAVLDRGGGASASAVAAGMIAPALEAATEDVTPDRAALLRQAAAPWPAFAAAAGVVLDRTPGEWRGPGAVEIAARLSRLGFRFERDGDRLTVADDAQVHPPQAMAALRRAIQGRGGRLVDVQVDRVERGDDGWSAAGLTGDALVIATGASAALSGLPAAAARALARIEPVRGQIGVSAEPLTDRVVRGRGAYVAPWGEGAVVGATMEPGRRDLQPDAAAAARLLEAAAVLLGRTPDPARIDWRVGVRGASADGLPLAGLAGPGLALATAPRRNGWLLAPLVARTVASALEGRPATPVAAALDPLRF